MNKYRQEYNEKKEKILNLLNSTKEYYEKYEKNNKVSMFDEIIKTVKQDEFSIVLVGEFSAGKSTFLNALMGEKLLPSFTRETTATINYLRHKDRAENGEEGRVYFSDGTVEILDKVDFETINKYVSTESGINVATTVEHVDLFLDSKFLEGNVTLVDSPGLNGTAEGHKEVTKSQIEKSSASIFMFKADQPGSETDFKFIGELKDKVNTIIFALNKIDEIKKSEGETVESVIESLKNIYKQKFPKANSIPEIWGISAYQALVARSSQKLDYRGRNDYTKEEKKILEQQSQMEVFEDRLWQFITKGEKARAMLLSPVDKVINSLKKTKMSAQEDLELLKNKNDKEEIEGKILELNTQIDSIKNKVNDIESQIEDEIEESMNEFMNSLESRLEKIKDEQMEKLSNWIDLEELMQMEDNIDYDINKGYKRIIKKCESEFKNNIKRIVNQNYKGVAKDINNSLRNFNFKVLVDTKYEPTELDFKLEIQKYEEQQEKIELELEEIEKELEQANKNLIKFNVLKNKEEELKKDKKEIEQMKSFYEQDKAPEERFRSDIVKEKQSRGGIFGRLADIFVGEKDVEVTKTVLINKEQIEKFNKSNKEQIEKFNKEIEELNKELKELKLNSSINIESSEFYEYEKQKIYEKREKIIDKKKQEQKKLKEKYESENKKALRTKKRKMENYIEEINYKYSKEIEDELYDKKDMFLNIIKSSIANNLSIKLEEKNNELLVLKNKLKSSQEEKSLHEERLNAMIKDSEDILANAVGINIELESEPVDTIEQEML